VITDVAGVRVGHWTDPTGGTGCTVVLFPPGTVASGEVRGGAPGTREFDLLAPHRTVNRVDAVVLSGGSAFGLAACDGVMRWCEERGIGFPTPAGPVPIVVGAVLFDLMVGDPRVRPTAASGYAACQAAVGAGAQLALGLVGAGTGATVGKWRGPGAVVPGGIGSASRRDGELIVAALMAVNASGAIRSGADQALGSPGFQGFGGAAGFAGPATNTTIGVIATNATLDKVGCLLVAQSGHDGLARALEPAHTTVDGDALVAAAVGGVVAPLDLVRHLAALAVEDAIRSAPPPQSASPTAR
jgi:L-aminopeptidase/D-esterase-like protein